jgi:hypothetical protein
MSRRKTKFATVKIELCARAGEYALEGRFAGEMEHGERVKQPVAFSPRISEEAGTKLTFGAKTATVEGKFEQALAGENSGQRAGEAPLVSDPPVFLVSKNKTKVGNSQRLTITHTVRGKQNVKFGQATIVGSAGVITIFADTCSKNEFAPTESCTTTVQVAPLEAKKYEASLLTPWETKDGTDFGGRANLIEGWGE